jgi:thymidylate kinase
MVEARERRIGIARPKWLAIEGTDATGKTQLTCELFLWLRDEYPEIDSMMIKEFSSSLVGRLIKEVINDKTFFMLGDNEHIPIAETLILGSDLMLQQETFNKTTSPSKKGIIISDRGIYSFFVYQGIRLRNTYGNSTDWEKWITDIFSPIGLPNLTLCLSSPIDQIERRLRSRRDKVSPESLSFINQAQNEFLRIGEKGDSRSFVVIENIDGEFNRTLNQAQRAVKEILIPTHP